MIGKTKYEKKESYLNIVIYRLQNICRYVYLIMLYITQTRKDKQIIHNKQCLKSYEILQLLKKLTWKTWELCVIENKKQVFS